MAAKAAAGAAEQAEVTPERVSRLREELGSLTELLRAEADLGRLDVRRADDEQQIAVAERIRAEAEATLAELTAREIELTAARNAAELLAVTLADREQDSVRATTIAKAVLEQQRLTDEQTAADDGLRTAIDVHQAAVAASQELRARRLDGMAAELAAGLGPDSQCPVCGSAEHPAPAAHHTAPVTELAQQQAEATEAAALAERELAQQAVNTAAQRLAAVRAVTEGADAETASAALIEAQRRVLEARAAAGQAGQLGAELDAVDTAQELALDQQQAARARAAAGRESLAEIEGRRSDLRERLDRARGADADVATRYGRLERTAAVLAECLTAKQAVDEASERLRRAQSAADEAAAAAGFEGRAAAGRALLPEPERERQTARLAEYDHRKARVEALLAELQAEAEAEIEAAAQPTTSKLEPTQVADTAQVGEAVQGAEAMQGVREPGVREPGVRKPGVRKPGVRKPGVRKPGVREQVVEDEVSEPLQLDLFAQFFGLTEHAVVAAEAPPDPAPAPAPAPDPQPEPQPSAGPEPLPDAQPSAEPEPLPDAQPSAESKPLPDLEALHLAQSQAREAHELARERHTLASRAVRALSGLAGELQRHASATAPLRRQFAALDSVSRCVEGTGGDNALRMRLSSYVLAARLEQVAAAASIRLAAMSGGRYLLVHTDGPARGGARSGLGLAVIDGWTGVQRDPASLSGGETFCTSLALALGLADVVQAEAGGSVIETLLVDEGFGSLDEQTLDEVMDVLDGLRSAGRSVGLVSHVGDLRDRIPAQLQVLKTRTGSQLVA
jgi:exonuclease SbcC